MIPKIDYYRKFYSKYEEYHFISKYDDVIEWLFDMNPCVSCDLVASVVFEFWNKAHDMWVWYDDVIEQVFDLNPCASCDLVASAAFKFSIQQIDI